MIDPRAIIDPKAILADNVEVGPWSYIGPDVIIGEGTSIASHVVIKGATSIGSDNRIFQFSSIGEDCQDKKYAGELTYLEVGDSNVFREGCTIHRGTVQDNSLTKIGSHNLFMAYAHVAHDCIVGDHVIMANNSAIAGHVNLGSHTILGGFTAVHQFCRIGSHVMCGAGTVVLKDVPDYVMATGNPAQPHGINAEGLKRRGFTPEMVRQIKQAYKIIYRQKLTVDQALQRLSEMALDTAEILPLIYSLQSSSRGVIR
ncbi:acyl-ACP--UDP-N-acetylglucosamine O-acyltransferase [Neptunomonas qingdaonensis]|uniref:Acyl-[acyl-carrier-protein]--UDP-N-acetylglucosamine O-acyltransferase n=1 Tax=Neptunomonas qingdaonensis TaxID=1045558 RepID=A0A1I2N732_9GAMM|nr:acyl-ACP--UDP-N-acetylglucosamine O-acyltransferase [Neptunomonas qingdaonensis]SFF99572.1 acyl-[acyl-carrier-protein]--UDP-N-acetylglucosamine O-acyltransferase [Neptunomonas qingdaonensis]